MPEPDYLKDLVIVLGAAVVVVAILRRVGVPSIAGFILAGALAGPTALRLVDDTRQVEVLAEIGVVLLLFGIGLEISLERLRRLWKAVLLGGGIQVGFTIAWYCRPGQWVRTDAGTRNIPGLCDRRIQHRRSSCAAFPRAANWKRRTAVWP